jgi:endonuclease YncB( thermonuclease family)
MMLFVFLLFSFIPPATLTGKAVKIIDGDTFDLLSNGTMYRIRLNGIDCPERGQAYYQQAKEALAKACAGSVLTVKYSSRDRNGRILGEVLVNGRSVNLLLVQQGYAWHYKKYSKDAQLAKSETIARLAKLGLWKEGNAIAPWEWRKRRTVLRSTF